MPSTGSPRSDVGAPLSPPGLVAAWPDSPGLLPRPRLLPSLGRGLLRPRGTCACPGKGSGDSVRSAGL